MKTKKAIKIGILAVLLLGLFARIAYVNTTSIMAQKEIHDIGDKVELKGSFSQTAAENTDGYSITVEGVEVFTYEECMTRFQKPIDYLSSNSQKTTAVLSLKIENKGNADGMIGIDKFFLFNDTFSTYFNYDETYLAIVNPQLSANLQGIRIQPDTQYTINFPFVLDYGAEPKSYLDLRKGEEKLSFYLMVSMYPVKNLIRVEI